MKFKSILALVAIASVMLFSANAFAQDAGAAATVSDVRAGATSSNGIGDINSHNDTRGGGFLIPHDITFPGFPAHFDKATPDHRFIPLKSLMTIQNTFSVEEAQNMLADAEGDIELKLRRMVRVADDAAPTASITVTTIDNLPAGTRKTLAMGTVAADGVDAISVDLMSTMVVEASKLQGTYIVFMGEGVNRIIKSFGWGFGLSSSYANMSDDGDDGMLVTGGLGISGGTAGYKHLPWLQYAIVSVQ